MDNQFVVFALSPEYFGINIAVVESIIKMQTITKIPHAPRYVEGVTNLRGKVVPVIDLRKRFGLLSQEMDKSSRIIVTNLSGSQIGMIVDEVSEVLTISDQSVEPVPNITTTVDSSFISGIAKMENRLVILLELAKVLTFAE